jgi:hypothetical protein
VRTSNPSTLSLLPKPLLDTGCSSLFHGQLGLNPPAWRFHLHSPSRDAFAAEQIIHSETPLPTRARIYQPAHDRQVVLILWIGVDAPLPQIIDCDLETVADIHQVVEELLPWDAWEDSYLCGPND